MNCSTIVNSTICVEANVKINADVEVGEVDTCCIGRPFMRRCRTQDNKSVCMVVQRMRVSFPLIYCTNVTAHSNGVACETVDAGRDSNECCHEHRECGCEEPRGCCEEPRGCCEDPRGCCEEPRGCCEEPRGCCQKRRGCCQELKNCSHEPSSGCKRARTPNRGKNQFNCPFAVLAALLFRGRCFHF